MKVTKMIRPAIMELGETRRLFIVYYKAMLAGIIAISCMDI